MAEGVRADLFGDAGFESVFAYGGLDGDSGEAAFFFVENAVFKAVDKEGLEVVVAGAEVGFDGGGGGFGKKDDTGFATFAADGKFATFEVDLVAIEFL